MMQWFWCHLGVSVLESSYRNCLKHHIHPVVLSEVKSIFERCFAVSLLAGTWAVFEVGVETSYPGRAADHPAEETMGFKRPKRRTHVQSFF